MTSFDRSAIMKAAHFTARWRVQSVGGSYRQWFAKALAAEWKKAKAARLRNESNIGLPVRTCFADGQQQRLPLCRLYTTHSGRLAGSFAA
ncbi:hypothetical protein [Methylocystis sp. B8]|uniref:hypothetical protein n=1 Tax=Methylocystis sp. B8 TaxID=544938 RepID=UPI0010FCF3C6|nr:hypothetical protein [Methylocystis sp. B8]TLG77792.1 hypothetical protein FEV16_08180 [Methylocystis sp. B8]